MDDYADVSQPLVGSALDVVPGLTESNGQLSLPLQGRPRGKYRFEYASPRARTLWTNILGGPYLVSVAGGHAVGRTSASWMVVRLPASGKAPSRLAFSEAHPWPVKLGIAASLASGVALLLALAIALRGRRRAR
jgi:hypothetical protein